MKPNKNIEKLLGQLQYRPDLAEEDKIRTPIDNAWQRHEAGQKALSTSETSGRVLGVRCAKLAVAAVIALVGLAVCIGILDKSTGPAYALEQTVEAVKDIRYFHFRLMDRSRENVDREAWVQYDPNGQLEKVRVNFFKFGSVMVWNNGITQNLSTDRSELSIFKDIEYTDKILFFADRHDPKNAIEYLKQREAEGAVRIEIGEPADRRDPIPVTVIYEPNMYLIGKSMPCMREVLHVDRATKLLSRIDVDALIKDSFERRGVWEYLDYNQPFEPGIFGLEKEIGTETTCFSTIGLDLGIEQGQMSEREIVVKVANEFLTAWKSKHYDRAVQIHGYMNRSGRDNLLQMLAKLDLLQIVEISEPSPAEPPMRGYTLGCTLQTRRGDTTDKSTWCIQVRRRTPTRWRIRAESVSPKRREQ